MYNYNRPGNRNFNKETKKADEEQEKFKNVYASKTQMSSYGIRNNKEGLKNSM